MAGAAAAQRAQRDEAADFLRSLTDTTKFGLSAYEAALHKDYVNLLLSGYFGLLGLFACTVTVSPYLQRLFPESPATRAAKVWRGDLPLLGELELAYAGSDIVAFTCSAVVLLGYLSSKHWICNNVLALSFAIQGLEHIRLGSLRNGAILLTGLFFYDIFWVFGTDVMVTVAKNFDAPIKIMFPRVWAPEMKFAMLGLGDIVVPGIFLSLLARFDEEREAEHLASRAALSGRLPVPMFTVAFAAFVAGLVTTIAFMHIFAAAQPALLYLVPFILVSTYGHAFGTGKLAVLLSYKDEEEAVDVPEAETETKANKAKAVKQD